MNSSDSLLRITYTGTPVAVDHERITEDMRVPNVGHDGSRYADNQPAESAVGLFKEAVQEGALVAPEGIVLDCFARDTYLTHDFLLLASAAGEDRAGVTLGWFDVELLAREPGDTRTDNDSVVVLEALAVMAGKLNAALKGGE